MPDRRETLKIMGAIGSTCAFPFTSNELYGQHVHPPAATEASYGPPKFFDPAEFTLLSRIADLIIPASATPGAIEAGVAHYIDYVVDSNEGWRKLFREGLAELTDQGFGAMPETGQIAVLTKYIDQPGDGLLVTFFRAMKSMTADGYYTSRIGLVQELGYSGNTVMAAYPSCEIPEH